MYQKNVKLEDNLKMLENNMQCIPGHSLISFSSVTQTDGCVEVGTELKGVSGEITHKNQLNLLFGNKSVPNFN